MSDEVENLRNALADAREAMWAVVTGEYPNPRDHRPGQCEHGRDYWEDCGSCVDEFLIAAIQKLDEAVGKEAKR